MAKKSARVRQNGRRLSRSVDYVALALIMIAAVALAALALAGVTLRAGDTIPRSSAPISTVTVAPTATPTPTAAPSVAVSLLGDRNSDGPNSWWAQLAATTVEGVALATPVVPTPASGTTGATVAELQSKIDAVPAGLSGYVVVQAGSADVSEGTASRTVAAVVQNLWKAVSLRGATPVVALLPPSNENPDSVSAVNELLKEAASTDGYIVVDLHSPVAAANGTWAAGYSDDGVVANEAGSRILAQAVAVQLAALSRNR